MLPGFLRIGHYHDPILQEIPQLSDYGDTYNWRLSIQSFLQVFGQDPRFYLRIITSLRWMMSDPNLATVSSVLQKTNPEVPWTLWLSFFLHSFCSLRDTYRCCCSCMVSVARVCSWVGGLKDRSAWVSWGLQGMCYTARLPSKPFLRETEMWKSKSTWKEVKSFMAF